MRRSLLALLALLVAAPLYAQNANQAQLRLVIVDETGAGIPGAAITVTPAAGGTPIVTTSDERGLATVATIPVGNAQLHVEFSGFETVDQQVAVKRGANNQTVTMKIAGLQEQVVVSDTASVDDRSGNAQTTTLEQSEIEQLPDDPDDLQAYLEQMTGGRGATFQVNGFRGGRLPSRDEIRQIRFRTNSFSADNHDAGRVQIEIITKPNVREWSGNANLGIRNDVLNARNAFAPVKTPEDINRFNMGLRGPLVANKTSIRLNVDGNRSTEADTIFALNPDGSRISQAFRRPSDRTNVNVGIEHALTKNQTLRLDYRNNDGTNRNQGVGGFNLLERAYDRTNNSKQFRAQVQGLVGKQSLNELRFEFNQNESVSSSLTNAPTIVVLDAFTAGGAGVNSQNKSHTYEVADNFDFNAGRKHAMRVGFLLNGGTYSNFDGRNAFGTYTYSSLDAYLANSWVQFTQRVGQVQTDFSAYQLGVYWQDDIRVNKSFSYSVGVRNELQSLISDKINPMPRVGFTWNPFGPKTTFRGGYGMFYDWYDTGLYDQVLRLNSGQQDLLIRNDGFSPGAALAGRTQTADNLQMPYEHQASIGVERPITNNLTVQVNYQMLRGRNQYRAVNVNAPVNGILPDPNAGVITEVRSDGKSLSDTLTFNTTFRVPTRRIFVNANYTLGRLYNYADSPTQLPANSLDPNAEWGPSFQDVRNRFNVQAQVPLPKGFRMTTQVNGQSATPYNITTGFDENRDGVVNDRPFEVGRNSARGASRWEVNGRIGKQISFGGSRNGSGGGREGAGNGGGRQGGGRPAGGTFPQQGFGGGGRGGNFNGGGENNNQRFSMELYAQGQNLLNHTNFVSYSGVVTSRLFGLPTAASQARRIEVGLQFRF